MAPLSVVLPVFNGERTLGDCLDALLAQLPADAEVIVVDDASTDGTAALLEGRPVRVLRNAENRGTSASRNRGWRASAAPLVVFLDADVVLRPGALADLIATLEASPELQGANGLLALDMRTPGRVSRFVNTSIHFQHLQHGDRVSSAFTSICVLRRETLEAMGGWDEQWYSRYADDVATRFALREGALGLARGALAEHLKGVQATGLLKHRFNVGYFWLQSTMVHLPELQKKPSLAVLDLRFPLNTISGGLLGLAALAAPLHAAASLGLLALFALVLVSANARYVRFTYTHHGPIDAAVALPLCALEGVGCAAGAAWAIVSTKGRWMAQRPRGASNGSP